MISRVELLVAIAVLLAGRMSGTAGLTATLKPDHVHSGIGKEVTFTCEADEPVTSCSFLIRFRDQDLPLVEVTHAQSSAWDLSSPPPKTRTPSNVTPNPRRPPPPRAGDAVDTGGVGQAGGRPSWNQGGGGEVGQRAAGRRRTETDADAEGEMPSASAGRKKSYVASQSSLDNSRQPPSQDRPVWSTTPKAIRRERSEQGYQGDEPAGSDEVWDGSHHLLVLGQTDGGGAAPARSLLSPYPADLAQTSRRPHTWNPAFGAKPNRYRGVVPAVGMRINDLDADAGYAWRTSVLPSGGCALTLPAAREGRHVIGCRVRRDKGGWEYAVGSLHVNRYSSMGLTSRAPTLVKAGSVITVTLFSTLPMTSCNVDAARGTISNGNRCQGSVTARPGPIWISGSSGSSSNEARPVFLHVRSAPRDVQLQLAKTSLVEGEQFTATCALAAAQPPANLSWYLGDEQLRADAEDDFPAGEWAWPWEGRGLTQSMHLTLTSDDDGTALTCRADHGDLATPLEDAKTLSVAHDDDTTECGTLSTAPAPSVKLGSRISSGSQRRMRVPWAVAVYRRMRGGDFEQVCGGTLVSRRLVVSSAQCFWDATFARIADASNFRVALGRRLRDWSNSNTNGQTPGVLRVAAPKHFLGRQAHYVYDVAVLVLDAAVTLSDTVRPACIDRTASLPPLQTGDMGVVAGWGVTEMGRASPGMRTIELPYVTNEECYRAIDAGLHRFLSHDKFCAGFRNKSKSVCPGDSGGGLVFKDAASQRHYLRGVASVAFAPFGNDDACFADLYTGFTMVSEYASWIFKQAPPPGTA